MRQAALLLLLLAGCAPEPVETARIVERPAAMEAIRQPVAEPTTPDDGPAVDRFDVDVGRFDSGKMWTFDEPPLDWLKEEYGLDTDSAWFARARLGALRFGTSCSASFVSSSGLIMTNHHCARDAISDVTEEGEDLLENGFYAAASSQERRVKDLHVDQLLSIEDVTASVHGAGRAVRGDNERVQVRRSKADEIARERMRVADDSTIHVEVVELFSGGRYAAYTFRRHHDIRLVMAPEKLMGYFGGDPDNFTYPRYALDVSFFRAYHADSSQLAIDTHYRWSAAGAAVGDPVFVVGSPGTTNRLGTVSQLEYERDFELPRRVEALQRREEVLRPFMGLDAPQTDALENMYFSISNSLKALTGQLAGLRNDTLIAQRSAAEYNLRGELFKSDSLSSRYGQLFQDLGEIQLSKRSEIQRSAAFAFLGTDAGSRILTRALYGYYYATMKQRGFASEEELEEVRKQAMSFENLPADVEQMLIRVRLEELQQSLGALDPTLRGLTGGESLDSVAARLATGSALLDSSRFAVLLEEGYLSSDDPSVPVINALAPLFFTAQQQNQSFGNREELLEGQLAQARLAIYGSSIPPDASFSLRFADGVVRGYPYNGTWAPAFTTFFGLYDHYHAYRDVSTEWDLPPRWRLPPEGLPLSTPLNLVSTNDITGGNSGSPLLNEDLEIVGLIFDGNIESLSNVYLFSDRVARAVSVDSRAIMAVLRHVYDADRLVEEINASQ
ncbi:MAG: S46 family peptidase [Bacteroidota bacterium]|nr:S46 family peptidase [Bacteroidota bacterium]MDE2955781.1 S46 family peptidase [Bacteroidota bacterium]